MLATVILEAEAYTQLSSPPALLKVYSLVNSISEKTYIKAMTIEATKLVPEKYVDMLQAVITKTDDVACNYWEKFMF